MTCHVHKHILGLFLQTSDSAGAHGFKVSTDLKHVLIVCFLCQEEVSHCYFNTF